MPIEWLFFIDGPLLEIVFYLFGIGLGIRGLAFLVNIFKSRILPDQMFAWKKARKILYLFAVSFLPFHRGVVKQPVYTLLRYLFHACLFIIPVFYSGHLNMLADTILGGYWEPIPDHYIEAATLLVIGMGCLFMARRVVLQRIRKQSSVKEVCFILITILPFITGYWYVNETLDHIAVFKNYMWYLHVFSGELMMATAVFLFIRTKLDVSQCMGCSSCTISCPTGTLEATETKAKRSFLYSHYQCICCGACVSTCPETAAILKHEISIPLFFSFFKKQQINEIKINRCEGCQKIYAPDPQIEKIKTILTANAIIPPETLVYCSRCKKLLSNHMILPHPI